MLDFVQSNVRECQLTYPLGSQAPLETRLEIDSMGKFIQVLLHASSDIC